MSRSDVNRAATFAKRRRMIAVAVVDSAAATDEIAGKLMKPKGGEVSPCP
ncbi:MAG: hypothetical protein ABFD46_03815 [Armatimonadota bacterium]